MSKNQRILVVGASGTVGSEVARLLKEQGFEVRTTTGKAATRPGQVHLNLLTGEGLQAAFEGIDRAFLLSPGGNADQHGIFAPLIHEAKRQELKKVVLMSAYGADADPTSSLRRAEVELERSGVPYSIIRPNWFMQNFNSFWVQGIREQGLIPLPAKQAKTSFIDARDIAAVAARLVSSDERNHQAVNLTGAESLTHDEVAQRLSQATGRSIRYQAVEPSQLRAGLLSAGLPKDYVEFLLMIFGYLAEGYNAAVNTEVRSIIGRDPIRFDQYAADFKQAWIS